MARIANQTESWLSTDQLAASHPQSGAGRHSSETVTCWSLPFVRHDSSSATSSSAL
jgi:hypothetical protein